MKTMITRERVDSRQLTIGVVGLGYVGLPTALGFHEAGFIVIGLDISEEVVNSLKEGNNPSDDPAYDNIIPIDERWIVSSNPTDTIPLCDVIIVTVPTPVLENHRPDLRFIQAAGEAIFENISKEKKPVVVLESTVYPGVTKEVWGPIAN